MRNVLFLHSSSELYGSDRSLLNLIKNLDENKYEITVVLPESGPLEEELLKVNNVEVYIKEIATLRRKHLSIQGIFQYAINFLGSINYLTRMCIKRKIDVVYTNTSVVFPGGVVAKLLKRKSIWHVREIIEKNFERRIVSKIVNLFSDVIIANSKATAKGITSNRKKVRIVYNAIEDTKTQFKESNILDRKNHIVIGMAGRINRWKGQKLFVDMAAEVISKSSSVEFVIAGDVYKGEDHILDDLKLYIKNKGIESKVTLLGQVNDMDIFYKNLDIFILPSIQPEPFGLVILEAMERGIPVIATRHGGPLEIINHQEDGFLVDHKHPSEMSNIVLNLITSDSLRKSIGQKGKQKRNKLFNINTYVEKISKILDEI